MRALGFPALVPAHQQRAAHLIFLNLTLVAGGEHPLLHELLARIEPAKPQGQDCAWEVEHRHCIRSRAAIAVQGFGN